MYFTEVERIYKSLDYRSFLTNWFENQKEGRPWLSLRYIAKKVEMDASTLVKVFRSRRHISLEKVPLFVELLKLGSQEAKYFEMLVRQNRTKNVSESQDLLGRLQQLRQIQLSRVKGDQLEFYHKWYHSALRALIGVQPVLPDYDTLARLLNPSISAREAQESIELLLDLNLVRPREDGTLEATDAFVTGGGGASADAIRSYQREAILLGERSLLEDSPTLRDISSLTVSIPRELHQEICNRLAAFRKSILALVEAEKDADCVYQLNLQWIPLSNLMYDKGENT